MQAYFQVDMVIVYDTVDHTNKKVLQVISIKCSDCICVVNYEKKQTTLQKYVYFLQVKKRMKVIRNTINLPYESSDIKSPKYNILDC